jgi:hypothetical protein
MKKNISYTYSLHIQNEDPLLGLPLPCMAQSTGGMMTVTVIIAPSATCSRRFVYPLLLFEFRDLSYCNILDRLAGCYRVQWGGCPRQGFATRVVSHGVARLCIVRHFMLFSFFLAMCPGERCTAEGDEIGPELGIVEASEGWMDG